MNYLVASKIELNEVSLEVKSNQSFDNMLAIMQDENPEFYLCYDHLANVDVLSRGLFSETLENVKKKLANIKQQKEVPDTIAKFEEAIELAERILSKCDRESPFIVIKESNLLINSNLHYKNP